MRRTSKLSARKVATRTEPGLYGDGSGLYLRVSEQGTKGWVFRYKIAGKRHDMGLGPLHTVSLAEARELALAARKLLREGVDPLKRRRTLAAQDKLAAASAMTFGEAAAGYIASHKHGWRSVKHLRQWEATLAEYVFPLLGELPVEAIDTGHVLKVLEPIWTTRTETASRVRGRLERVLSWATSRGYRPRTAVNPAIWRGHLQNLLPKPGKVKAVTHLPALPYSQIGKFLDMLRMDDSIGARALEVCILTACRSGEVRSATWAEIDLEAATWTVPAGRTKGAREHRIPLSSAALNVLERVKWLQGALGSPFLFPGNRHGKPINASAMRLVLRRIDPSITTHGFRSSFRDWASERTGFSNEVCEAALAHAIGSKVEAAYRRGDLFEKRKQLMELWGEFCSRPRAMGSVIPIREQK